MANTLFFVTDNEGGNLVKRVSEGKAVWTGTKCSEATLKGFNLNGKGVMFVFGEEKDSFEPFAVAPSEWGDEFPALLAGKNFAFVESALGKKPLRAAAFAVAKDLESAGKNVEYLSDQEGLGSADLFAAAEEAVRVVKAVSETEFAAAVVPGETGDAEADDAGVPAEAEENDAAESAPSVTDETDGVSADGLLNGVSGLSAEPDAETEKAPEVSVEPDGIEYFYSRSRKNLMKGYFPDGNPYGPFVLTKGSTVNLSKERKNSADARLMREKAELLGYLAGNELVKDATFSSAHAALAFGYGETGDVFKTADGKTVGETKKGFAEPDGETQYKKRKKMRFVSDEEIELAEKFGKDAEIRLWIQRARGVERRPVAATAALPDGTIRFFLFAATVGAKEGGLIEFKNAIKLSEATPGSVGSWFDLETGKEKLYNSSDAYIHRKRAEKRKAEKRAARRAESAAGAVSVNDAVPAEEFGVSAPAADLGNGTAPAEGPEVSATVAPAEEPEVSVQNPAGEPERHKKAVKVVRESVKEAERRLVVDKILRFGVTPLQISEDVEYSLSFINKESDGRPRYSLIGKRGGRCTMIGGVIGEKQEDGTFVVRSSLKDQTVCLDTVSGLIRLMKITEPKAGFGSKPGRKLYYPIEKCRWVMKNPA